MCSSTLYLPSALDKVWIQRHAPTALLPVKWRGTSSTRVWVGLRAGMDMRGKSRPHLEWNPDRPARNVTLFCRRGSTYRVKSSRRERKQQVYRQNRVTLFKSDPSARWRRRWYSVNTFVGRRHHYPEPVHCSCLRQTRATQNTWLELGFFKVWQ